MEKSMIQDLDGMRTSLGYRNTFTTSFHEGGYELKKSKISNLPSHKKSDLSVKLPFVVVFQTMEIERLSQEIEALRVALKDSQRQAFNCQSYQVQIRELTDQCHDYDVEVMEYKEEIEKLNMISQKLYQELQDWKDKYQNFDPMTVEKFNAKLQQCQNLQTQISKWRDRYRALQKSKDKELQDLKLWMQNQRKSVLDREIGELNIKFQAERSYLQNQIRKMEEAADQRDDELTKAKYETQALRIENEVNLDANRKLKESENKMNKLTEQLVRINQLLRRKQQQIQRKDANEDYLKEFIKTLEREKINHQNEAIKVPQLEGTIKQWIVRFSRLQNQNSDNKQKLQRVPLLQNNLETCTLQIERLGMIVKTKLQQINQSNIKVEKYRSLYQQSKKSEQKVPSLQRKITEMGYQAERLSDILKKRLVEVEQGKSRIMVLEKALRAFEQAEPEKRRTQQQLKRQVREVQRQRKDIKDLQKQIKKIPELELIVEQQRNMREDYCREVDRLNKTVKDKSDECETLIEKIEHLQAKVAELCNIEQEVLNFKAQNNRLVQQIDNMNGKIKQKCDELDNIVGVVEGLQQNLEHYKKVQERLVQNIKNTEKIIEQLNMTKVQLQSVEQQLLNRQSELADAKNIIIEINNDKQILNRNLNLKIQELERANLEINQCLTTIQQLREVQRCYHALQEEMRVTQNKLRDTEEWLKKQKARNEELDYKNQMLIGEIEKIRIHGYFPEQFRMQFENVKATSYSKDKQIQKLLQKQNSMEKYTDQIQGMIFNICETMKVKNSEWVEINKKITESIKNVNRLGDLQNQNTDLRTQILQLESQIKILNLQILENQVRKNTAKSNQMLPNTTPMSSTSTSSWSFNTVSSKKAIDTIVQSQAESRLSSVSNHRRVLTSTNNILMNSTSKSKLEQARSSVMNDINKPKIEETKVEQSNSTSKYTLEQRRSSIKSTSQNQNINLTPSSSSASSYQYNPSSASITSSRGFNANGPSTTNLNGYISPPKIMSSTVKQSSESYYTSRVMKTSSVREPFTVKSPYRA